MVSHRDRVEVSRYLTLSSQAPTRVLLPGVACANGRWSPVPKERRALTFDQTRERHQLQSTRFPTGPGQGRFIGTQSAGRGGAGLSRGGAAARRQIQCAASPRTARRHLESLCWPPLRALGSCGAASREKLTSEGPGERPLTVRGAP